MPDKSEKQKRKELREEYSRKQREEFQNGLPMGNMLFTDLFGFLDEKLSEQECDNELTLTKAWIEVNSPENANEIIRWLQDHGGYCDCEVLMNVEEYFN